MQDTELYRYLLGLKPPWKVERVKLDVINQRVDIWAYHTKGLRWACPECGKKMPLYDHGAERMWRHLDSCQFMTFLHARPPRVHCKNHGVRQVRLPWAEEKARFTALFERLAIDVMLACDILSASRILRISWDEAWHIMERAVRRGLKAKKKRHIKQIGVDEKTAGRGHDYVTVVNDLERATVEHVEDGRKKESLDAYFVELSRREREKIEAIAVDIWDPFLASIWEHVPEAEEKIVFDRYHLMTHMVKAVDQVRKEEHRELKKGGDKRLSGSKYLWLYSRENLPARHKQRFQSLKQMHLKTARAWAIKESLNASEDSEGLGDQRELEGVLEIQPCRLGGTSFQGVVFLGYTLAAQACDRGSADVPQVSDSDNDVLPASYHQCSQRRPQLQNWDNQEEKKAYGFRNREHFKTAIYFHCGGLNLYPVTHKNV